MNHILLIGTVVAPPVYYCTEQGQDLSRIQLSTPGRNAVRAETILHHCRAWGPAALDLHEHLKVGDRLLVRGELQYRQRRFGGEQRVNIPVIHIHSYSYLGRGEINTFIR